MGDINICYPWGNSLVAYKEAMKAMEQQVHHMKHHEAPPSVWFLEHQSVYTCGPMVRNYPDNIQGIPVIQTHRGGKMTYHGPGQRIIYAMVFCDGLRSVHHHIRKLQLWVIHALECIGLETCAREGYPGVWCAHKKRKIASVGVAWSQGVTSHGIALNVHSCMAFFRHISPCGLLSESITSLEDMGHSLSLAHIDTCLHETYPSFLYS